MAPVHGRGPAKGLPEASMHGFTAARRPSRHSGSVYRAFLATDRNLTPNANAF
jgi:hypothetical protein